VGAIGLWPRQRSQRLWRPLFSYTTARRGCDRPALPPLPQPLGQEVVQRRDGADLLHRLLHIVLDAAVADGSAVDQDGAGAPVPGARLTDAADVAQHLPLVERIDAVDVLGAEELLRLGEDARHVRVALEAVTLHQLEDAAHLGRAVDVLGKDVLVE